MSKGKLQQYPFTYSHDDASGEGTVDATSKSEAKAILEKGINEQGPIKNLKLDVGDAIADSVVDTNIGAL